MSVGATRCRRSLLVPVSVPAVGTFLVFRRFPPKTEQGPATADPCGVCACFRGLSGGCFDYSRAHPTSCRASLQAGGAASRFSSRRVRTNSRTTRRGRSVRRVVVGRGVTQPGTRGGWARAGRGRADGRAWAVFRVMRRKQKRPAKHGEEVETLSPAPQTATGPPVRCYAVGQRLGHRPTSTLGLRLV